jgi:hypothetical protein
LSVVQLYCQTAPKVSFQFFMQETSQLLQLVLCFQPNFFS